MGLTRADLEDPNISDKDKKEIAFVLERMQRNDRWAKKATLPVGVLLTSHPGNRAFLKASVETHKRLGFWITLAYDNYLDPEQPGVTYESVLPARDVLDQVDAFIMPHHQTWGGVLYPYFWLLKFGLFAMSCFEYIYCSNGDCVLEKPEGFPKIMELLGDADIIGCGWDDSGRVPTFNTTAFLVRSRVVPKLMDHFQKHFIPFENYEKYTQEIGNAEARFARAILDTGVKYVKVEPGFNTQFHKKGFGTWYEILGFRHIHAELGYSYKHGTEPPEPKYFDWRYLPPQDAAWIESYWRTRKEEVKNATD